MIDEFTVPTLKATELNEMCDGSVSYPSKGCQPIRLDTNPYIVICANKPIHQVYINAFEWVRPRFVEICVDKPAFPPILKVPAKNPFVKQP